MVLDIQEGAPGRCMSDRGVLVRCLLLLLNFAVDAAANAAVASGGGGGGGNLNSAGSDGGGGGGGVAMGKVILSVSDVAMDDQSQGSKSACKISVFYTNPPDTTEVPFGNNDATGSRMGGEQQQQHRQQHHGTTTSSSIDPSHNNGGFETMRECYSDAAAPNTNNQGDGLVFGLEEHHQQHNLNRGNQFPHINRGLNWGNNHHASRMEASSSVSGRGGGSMMRRIRLRESIERGMTSCRRDKLGLGLSLLYHLVGAQGSDLRYEMVAEEPTSMALSSPSSSSIPCRNHSFRVTLPSMTKFWFLLPMSLDFPERLPAEQVVMDNLQNQTQNPLLPIPLPRSPSYSSFRVDGVDVPHRPKRKRAKLSEPVSFDPSGNNGMHFLNANLMGTMETPAIYSQHPESSSIASAPGATMTHAASSNNAAAAASASASASAAIPMKNYPGVVPGSRPLVLVVEDTDVSASLLCMHLRKLNCTSHRAENGEVALEMLRSAPTPNMYSLILMDLRMPVMDGFEATTIIKGSNASNIPVIALTGETSEENRRKCDEIGFDDYKTKPLKRPQLKELLKNFVPGYQAS